MVHYDRIALSRGPVRLGASLPEEWNRASFWWGDKKSQLLHSCGCCLSTHDDLVMQAEVWLCMVQFRATQFSAVWSGLALHMRIYDDPTHLSTKFKGKTLSCIQTNVVVVADDGQK